MWSGTQFTKKKKVKKRLTIGSVSLDTFTFISAIFCS